ncbi:hypothetical protein SAMN05192574_101131 [Mucilaginibacter gossypiicola]|uniref:Uncharacterized protein n=1 Tax=Mucilaginibacter gossypiicola TaxID=551995 RepID=A0A1H7ZRG9_9SPHI|nr:hypothetical protein SAMN05192574_101131 [Mucilaginibacter gossypiicola]
MKRVNWNRKKKVFFLFLNSKTYNSQYFNWLNTNNSINK